MEKLDSKEKIKFPEIAQEINTMAEIDQNMRKREINEQNFFDDSVDKANTARMKEIVEEIGWPTISKVGSEASMNAWLIVQHADLDVEFQAHCVSLMRQEAEGGVSPHDIAYLEDRVRSNTGRPQLYGTQFKLVDGKFIPKDIEDPEHVDERRKEMGLDTLEENTDGMYTTYKVEKPKE